MLVHGHCHCGAIRYEAEVDPERVTICHCSDCQSLTGSAYRVTVRAEKDAFHLRAGEPKVYVKVGDSGARRAQAFCANCGSPLYTYSADKLLRYGLRVGCLDERHALPPKVQVWCRSALAWAMDVQGLPRRERE